MALSTISHPVNQGSGEPPKKTEQIPQQKNSGVPELSPLYALHPVSDEAIVEKDEELSAQEDGNAEKDNEVVVNFGHRLRREECANSDESSACTRGAKRQYRMAKRIPMPKDRPP